MLDTASGWLLQGLVVFTTWALGAADRWAVLGATGVSLVLGLLWVAKRVIAWREEYDPPRWEDPVEAANDDDAFRPVRGESGVRCLGFLQAVWLGMVVVSLFNPGVMPSAGDGGPASGGGVRWLPRTLDRGATMLALLEYLGLFGAFWAARDWLMYRTARDRKELEREKESGPPSGSGGAFLVPGRLRRLLWVLCVNGAVLASVGFLQRASGTTRLLGLISPGEGVAPEAAFGPWPDRGHAAQYFNLLWPVCLGFWLWMQERAARASTSALARFDGPQIVLLPCAVLLAICPAISGNRGAALVSLGLGVGAVAVLLLVSRRQVTGRIRLLTVSCVLLAAVAAASGGWSTLRDRLTRPDHVLPTGVQAGSDPFTLFLRVRPGVVPPAEWMPLVHLRDELQAGDPAHSASVGISPDGALVVQVTGADVMDLNRKSSGQFVSLFGGKDVLLTVVRDRELRIYADGNELGAMEGRGGDAPGWYGRVGTRYLNVVSRMVTEVGLVDAALPADELASVSRTTLGSVGARLEAVRAYEADSAALTNGLVVSEGATAELRPDPQSRNRMWVHVRRRETSGPLGFRRVFNAIDPMFKGTVLASFAVQNSEGSPLALRVSVDSGEPAVVEIPPQSERAVAVRCRVPHGGPPRAIDIAVAERTEGHGPAVVAAGADLVVRDLRVASGATLFAQTLDPELRLGTLAGQIVGRPEVREAAARMVAWDPVWGTGAGTFAAVYPVFAPAGQARAMDARDDWLQARATRGMAGVGVLAAGWLALLVRGWFGRGLPTLRVIVLLIWMSVAGSLVNAMLDAPMQSYSVVFLLTLVAAVTTVLGVASGGRRR